jgi:hypothetical protein
MDELAGSCLKRTSKSGRFVILQERCDRVYAVFGVSVSRSLLM